MFAELLGRLAAALDAAEIPYMVIGGQAVLVYGEPRLTRDIDVTLGLGADACARVIAVAHELGLKVIGEHPAEFAARNMVLPALDPGTGIRVDFVFSNSAYERQALPRARIVMVSGREVRFTAIEDLLIHKLVAGRPRDLEDVRAVLLKRPAYDREYLERWLREFDTALAGDCAETFRRILAQIS